MYRHFTHPPRFCFRESFAWHPDAILFFCEFRGTEFFNNHAGFNSYFRIARQNEAARAADAAACIGQAYLRLKEEAPRRTITGVNARSSTLTSINNQAFRVTPFVAMASSSKSIEFP